MSAPRVLTVNPGTSSLKLSVLDGDEVRAARGTAPWPDGAARGAIEELVEAHAPLDAVAIRFVHGGDRAGPVLLDEPALTDLDALSPRAPLHQPHSVRLARWLRDRVPRTPLVGCFDTSFHRHLPERAARYALPRPWSERPELRRAGFHGLSCEYAVPRAAALLGVAVDRLGVVVAHIGSGVSVTAVSGGRSVDTSMGFTPADGAVMATRPGSLDPGLVLHLLRHGGLDPTELESALLTRAGLAGMAEGGGDLRTLLAARADGDAAARSALGVYLHRLRREIGAAAVALDALDALVLTGGVAEGSAQIRSELAGGLGVLGVALDPDHNVDAGADTLLSPPGAPVGVVLVHAREDLQLARGAATALRAGPDRLRTG